MLEKYSKFVLCGLVALFSTSSFAFQFQFLGIKDPVHQDMAESALKCYLSNQDLPRYICDGKTFEPTPPFVQKNVNELDELTVSDVREAVTWPDDPVRELRMRKVHKVVLWTFRMLGDECENYRGGLKDGLRCTTHYGNLQFMHSMESTKEENPAQTQKAILDWIEYAYLVALNERSPDGYFNDLDYCEYFKSENPSKFQQSMAPQNVDGTYQFPCNHHDDTPWTTSTPFAFSCWFGSSVCSEYSYGNNYVVRKAALGAVLHAIQDSFAKGHTSRGGDTLTLINTYECAPIRQFQLYTEQDHDIHGVADQYPTASDSCLSRNSDNVDGPVTASAEVLRMFFDKKKSSDVRKYLSKHVFNLAGNSENSGTTKLFE